MLCTSLLFSYAFMLLKENDLVEFLAATDRQDAFRPTILMCIYSFTGKRSGGVPSGDRSAGCFAPRHQHFSPR